MTDGKNTIKPKGILDRYRETLEHSPAELYECPFEDKEETLDQIYSYIKTTVDYLEIRYGFEIELKWLLDFKKRFDTVFYTLKTYLQNNWENSYLSFYNDLSFIDLRNELLHLSLWDDDFADDPNGNLSPFGPLLIAFRRYKRKRRVGILRAAEQQLGHIYADNLRKAQRLAKEIHYHFMSFASSNNLGDLKRGCEYPPVVQFCAGGAAALFVGLPVPTFIAMDKTKADEFSKFSALPHECGHNLAGLFKNSGLLTGIKKEVETTLPNNPRVPLWQKWIEECLADAIGVAIIKEGEIFSLANLFADNPTNRIYKDNCTGEVDEHPIRHIRVLLTIAVGRLLRINEDFLTNIEREWNNFGKRINKKCPHNEVFNEVTRKREPMQEYIDDVKQIAGVLVDTPYKNIKVIDIFSNFINGSKLAREMRDSILKTDKKWMPENGT